MDISWLRPVFDGRGPFATVYLEGRSPSDDAPTQVRLRWKSLRERLTAEDADPPALDAIQSEVLGEESGEVQAMGRVLVANADGLVLDAPWDAALGSGDGAHWTDDPSLGALLREQARAVRLLVAIVDQQGAVVRQEVVAQEHVPGEAGASTVEGGSPFGVHKPRGGALAHNQIQRHADEAVHRNAKDIVGHLSAVAARFGPRTLVLAGEAQGRSAIRDQLPAELAAMLVETGRGGTDDDAAEAELADELRRIASEASETDATSWTERLAEAEAHGRAVEGPEPVARAADMGAVATLLLAYERHAPGEAAVIGRCVRGGADLGLLVNDEAARRGVAAILRFALPDGAEPAAAGDARE